MESPKPPRQVMLRADKARAVERRHPWLFSGALADETPREDLAGKPVRVCVTPGEALALGFYNPASSLRVRLIAFGAESERPWQEIVKERLARAVALRAQAFDLARTDSFRLVNGEGDGLSGLVVDVYAGHAVIEVLARWVERQLPWLVAALREAYAPLGILRSVRWRVEEEAAAFEGMTLAGGAEAEAPTNVEIREDGLTFDVDLDGGQKTGFFLDQRDNRRLVGQWARGRVLNLFSYTGGFSAQALRGGAEQVVSVDASAKALASLEESLAKNGLAGGRHLAVQADVKRYLPDAQARGEAFDLVVCDPPPLARKRSHVERAARAYKDFNRRSLSLIPNGHLFTFSCSPYIDEKLFRQIVFSAAAEADVDAQILGKLGPGLDHPVSLFHPEGDYLCGLWLRVTRRS